MVVAEDRRGMWLGILCPGGDGDSITCSFCSESYVLGWTLESC